MRAALKRLVPTFTVLLASCLLLAFMACFRAKDHALEVERDGFATGSSFIVSGDESVRLADLGPWATAVTEAEDGIWLFEANNYGAAALPYHDGPGLSGIGPEALVGSERLSEVRDGFVAWNGESYKIVGTLGEKDDSLLSGSMVLSAKGLLDGLSPSDLRFDGFGARFMLALAHPNASAQGLDRALSAKMDKQVVIVLFTVGLLLISALGIALAALWYARSVRDEFEVLALLGKSRRVVFRGAIELFELLLIAVAIGVAAFRTGMG